MVIRKPILGPKFLNENSTHESSNCSFFNRGLNLCLLFTGDTCTQVSAYTAPDTEEPQHNLGNCLLVLLLGSRIGKRLLVYFLSDFQVWYFRVYTLLGYSIGDIKC